MGVVQTLIGNVKGPQGEQGAQGVQGVQGEAATISVGTVTTVQYGQNASVTNSGTEQEAILDFRIPQGRPGEQVTQLDNLVLNSITEPSTQFPVPAIGDIGSVLFGKVSKWFSDMSALVATKLNVANVVNNLTTTASGYALDARQGKALNDILTNFMICGSPATRTSNGNVSFSASFTNWRAILIRGVYNGQTMDSHITFTNRFSVSSIDRTFWLSYNDESLSAKAKIEFDTNRTVTVSHMAGFSSIELYGIN